MVRRILLALILALVTSPAWGDIYVSLSGNDSTGNGTIGNPYRTVQAGVNALSAGGTLYLRGGTYVERMIDISAKNDGSAENGYKMCSYPGEWAVIDGEHGGSDAYQCIIYSATKVSHWTLERMEITGGGKLDPLPVRGAGIFIGDADHCIFRYLYVHDNYETSYSTGATGGIHLYVSSTAPQDNVIEYCHIYKNGAMGLATNSAIANIAIHSDQKYAAEVSSPQRNNIVRYCLLDGGTDDAAYTSVGITQKGFQRLTGYDYGEAENQSDSAPNDDSMQSYGDKYHHNIIKNVRLGMRLDQDYVQAYNNIIELNAHGGSKTDTGSYMGLLIRDHSSDRRGPYKPVIYNNTIFADSGQSILYHPVANNWNSTDPVPYFDSSWIFGNIINNHVTGYDWSGISIESDESPKPTYPLDKINVSRNFFFSGGSSDLIQISTDFYTKAEIEATDAADVVWAAASPSPYIGELGADKYRTSGSYALDETYTIANGGLGGSHPYLSGVTIPSYVGAVSPSDSAWVAGVLGLDVEYFTAATGDPTWIEGEGGEDPPTPSGTATIRAGGTVSWH